MNKLIRYCRSVGILRSITLMAGAAGAAGMFVWTVGFAVSVMAQRKTLAEEMTTPYDCWVSTARAGIAAIKGFGMQELMMGSPFLMIPGRTAETIRKSPLVKTCDGVAVFRTQLRYSGFTELSKTPPLNVGVARASQFEPGHVKRTLRGGRWVKADAAQPEIVVSEAAFTTRNLEVPPLGAKLQISTQQGVLDAKLVGLLAARKTVSGFPNSFVSDCVMDELFPDVDPDGVNLLLCVTGNDHSAAALRTELIATCGEKNAAKIIDRQGLVAELRSDLLKNFARQIPLLLTLAVLTAACLIGTAARISIRARMKIFAQYRILGMTRRQLIELVIRETTVLQIAAWILGSAAGLTVLKIFVRFNAGTFPDGIPFTAYLLGPAAALLMLALISAIVLFGPLRTLFREEPLKGLKPDIYIPEPVNARRTLLGLLLTPTLLILLLPFTCSPYVRSGLILFVGIPSHLYGLYCLLPAVLDLTDRLTSKFGGILFRHSTSRSAGGTIALIISLTAGLGSYCAVQIWGASMIAPFIPSKELPDVIISMEPRGFDPKLAARFAEVKGVKDFEPFHAAQYVLADPLLQRIEKISGRKPLQNNVLLINLRTLPKNLSYTEGGADGFTSKDCIVPEMFARQGNLSIGDTLTIRRPARDGSISEHSWTIKGIVDLNWHLFTARSGLRGRSGAPFGTLAPVLICDSSFSAPAFTPNPPFAWFNLEAGMKFNSVERVFKEIVSNLRKNQQPEKVRPGEPGPGGIMRGETRLTLQQRDEIADGTMAHGTQLVGELARIPFYALVFLTIGITAVVQANIQSRTEEFALLRRIGMTRRCLLKLLLGEVLLLLISGTIMSLLFGLGIGWVFTAWTRAWMVFGGLPVVLRVPWMQLGEGTLFVMLLGFVYACIPITLFIRKTE